MAEDLIRYDVLAQEALRGLVKKVLSEVAQAGLPGEHHFFVTFNTQYTGVRISSRLAAEYPGEMTVVLQHQFWDLTVTDSAFEVGLSFKGVPEKLHVPLRAITSFVDPHASFALKFDVAADAAVPAAEVEKPAAEPQTAITSPKTARKSAAKKPGGKEKAAEPDKAAVVSLDAFRKKNV
jgi:hypothetical protein